MSRHRLRKYPNLTKDLKIDCAEQLWVSDITYLRVSDITYLRVEGTHGYLILITDAYSRKVVGYNFGRNMDTTFCILALENALANRYFSHRKLMHHSDPEGLGELQYCSKAYVEILKNNRVCISILRKQLKMETLWKML